MLAGGYSKQYQTLEQEHLNNLKTTTYNSKIDVLARAKRLSHETNKRRKAQAIKRKQETLKEESRRKEILAKRHEEHKIATERFQRSHIPNSRPTSSRFYRYSTTVDDALKLVRGSPPNSRQHSFIHHGGRTSPLSAGNYPSDPLNRPYVNKHRSQHHRPSSPVSPTTRERAEMMDKSLRNWNDSKSLFEQQLEQHQLLLLDQQQKSLYEFNEAISNEIAKDNKVNGVEDEVENNEKERSLYFANESFSSVDSLEDSLNFKNKYPQKDVTEVPMAVKQDERIDLTNNLELLAHNLIYPVNPGVGAKGSFYLETNKNINSVETNQLNRSYVLPQSDIATNIVTPMSQSITNTVPESTVKPLFVLNGNILQANVTPVPQSNNVERPTSHIKTWVDSKDVESTAVSSTPSTANSNKTMATTYDLNSTPQTKPRTIFKTNSTSVTSGRPPPHNGTSVLNPTKTTPASYFIVDSNTAVKPPIPPATTTNTKTSEYTNNTPVKTVNKDSNKVIQGTLLSGTLHLVNGQLVSASPEERLQSKYESSYIPEDQRVLTRSQSTDNIVGILKKSSSYSSIRNVDTRDSLEITKLKRQASMDSRPKSGKKSVRFADLSDDEDSTDILMSSLNGSDTNRKLNLKQNKSGSPGKTRPSSARVVSKMSKVPPSAPKPPRASSAGSVRSGSKPKAAAHIITHDPIQTQQSEAYYKNLQSTLEKKVTIVNNNFMSKSAQNGSPDTNTTINNTHIPNGTSTTVVQLKLTDATRHTPTNSTSPPQQQPKSSAKAVFNENGLRIDRTPTDDEINQLWENVRTCLHPDDDEKNAAQVLSDSIVVARQKVPVSNTVIDGGSLGSVAPAPRIGSAYQQRTTNKTYQPRQPPQSTPNGYLKKYGLLQQRRQDKSNNQHSAGSKRENTMPQITPTNVSPSKRDDLVSDSMTMFMMAEQLANHAVPESHINQAMDDLQTKQSTNKSKVPSALSMEEKQLMESLDRLNDKLKISEGKYQQQVTPQTITVNNTNQASGFRGRRPITAHQRRHTDGIRTDYLLRAASAYGPSQRQYR